MWWSAEVKGSEPVGKLETCLNAVPRALASRGHILFLIILGVWLIVTPLVPGTEAIRPSNAAELIGGNWTNVSSALGACIAAGASLKAHSEAKRHRHLAERIHALLTERESENGSQS
jgi:hypothetical protein